MNQTVKIVLLAVAILVIASLSNAQPGPPNFKLGLDKVEAEIK